MPGPIVLVGHSYGGSVSTDAATGNSKALGLHRRLHPGQGRDHRRHQKALPRTELVPSALSFVPSVGGVLDAYVKPSQFRSILANGLRPSRPPNWPPR